LEKYRFLEHTADALFQAFGKDFRELLENSAEAMCSAMYNLEKVQGKERVEVKARGESKEELLHNFLETVLFEVQAMGLIFSKFKVVELDEERGSLKAELLGEKIDEGKHELKADIKAVTWHSFFVKKEGDKWVSQVLVDI